MDNLTLHFLTRNEWLAANPLRRWRESKAETLPVPVTGEPSKVALPQQDVASMVGSTRSAISYWENGIYMPKFDFIVLLAHTMDYESAGKLYDDWQAWRNAKPADVQPVAV